jgi:predicted nucleic acid-binding protein
MILLDTNLISELNKPDADQHVLDWWQAQHADSLYLSAITEAELRHGVLLLPARKRRSKLAEIITAIVTRDFGGKILPFDSTAAIAYAEIAAHRRRIGRPIGELDCQIAAIAKSLNASLATRDTGGFADCGVVLINPWKVRV